MHRYAAPFHDLTIAQEGPLARRPRAAIPGYHGRGIRQAGLRQGHNALSGPAGVQPVAGGRVAVAGLTTPHW
ncbi:hypothetical protein GCM10027162_08520 [Streptomyces incanus]